MHAFGSDLRDNSALGLLDEDGIETIAATDEEWTRLHRSKDTLGDSGALGSRPRKARIGARHLFERHREFDDTASVDSNADVVGIHTAPVRDLVEATLLHVVTGALVSVHGPPRRVRAREHRGMFARAVVMQSRGPLARLAQQLGPPIGERLMRPAREIAFLEAHGREHALRDRDMLRFAAVRRARERELVVPPMQIVETARVK